MSPSASSSAHNEPPISWLPKEMLSRVLLHLPTPLDLYRASLVSHDWRSIAVDPHLWQPFYWAFYRANSCPQNDEDRALLAQRNLAHRKGMRAWVDASRTSAASHPLGCLVSTMPSGATTVNERLGKAILMISHMRGGADFFESTIQRTREIVAEAYGPAGPSNPREGASLVTLTLLREYGMAPTQDDFDFAEQAWLPWREAMVSLCDLQQGPRSYPSFIAVTSSEELVRDGLPDFYNLFVKRLNSDERLLRDLQSHVKLGSNRMESLLQIVKRYGDGARDVLTALAAHESITSHSIQRIAQGGIDNRDNWPRAFDVHARAYRGDSQPHFSFCVSLRYAAFQLLGHLQRQEAVRSMRKLCSRFPSPGEEQASKQPLRERVERYHLGVEEALSTLSLFRSGETNELSAYLDFLALSVWAEMDALDRNREIEPINPPLPDTEEDAAFKLTTRCKVMRIYEQLRRLGLCPAEAQHKFDLNNFFINVAAFCPAHRATSPLVFSVLLCGICRRLGVAATLANGPTPAVIVIEDGEKPSDFAEDKADWACFFLLPLPRVNISKAQYIFTTVQMAEHMAANTSPTTTAKQLYHDIDGFLEPTSPVKVLKDVAEEMLLAVHNARTDASRDRAEDTAPVSEVTSSIDKPHQQLSLLRDHLWGRSLLPPWPLAPAVLPSSLALLPSMKAKAKRVNSVDLRQPVTYAALWTLRVVDPERDGSVEQADSMLAGATAARQMHCPDLRLLLENHGANVDTELDLARRSIRSGDVDEEVLSRLEGPHAPYGIRAFVVGALTVDQEANKGLGGEGGGDSSREKRDLLDPSHPRNARVEFRVGTVFTHRSHGRRGVIIGWDSNYKGPGDQVSVDTSVLGGLKQPFYHACLEDGTHAYVAQSNIIEASISAGSSPTQATAVLQKFLPLFALENVGRCFRTVAVERLQQDAAEVGGEKKGGVSGSQSAGWRIKMVMNEWMRQAWPFG